MNANKGMIRSMLSVGIAVLLLAGAAGCGSDEAASGPRFDEIDVSQPQAAELRDLLIEQQDGDLAPKGEDRIEPALFATITTVIFVYVRASLRRAVVDQALDEWEETEILLGGDTGERGGQELNDERIAEIRADLENGWEDLPLDTFLDLPAIVTLYEQLPQDLEPLNG